MSDAVQRALSLLAREIDARWHPEPRILVRDSLSNFERKMASIIFRYGIHASGESGTLTLQHFATKSSMEIMMESIRRWLGNHSRQQARIITQYLKKQIEEKLGSGLSDAEIKIAILKIINRKGSAARIARTIIHGAMERGAYLAAQSLGVRMSKEWALGDIPNHRPDHVAADGQIQEIDDPFIVGGGPMDHPGDEKAPAKQIVNCGCTALYYLVINGEIRR